MSNIFERIKKNSALKANDALIMGARSAAPTAPVGGTKPSATAPSAAPPQDTVDTPEETTDSTSTDEVVEEKTKTPPATVLKALGKVSSPNKATKDEVKKSMGKGFVGETFGDVEETTTGTAAIKDDYVGEKASNEDWEKFLATDKGKAYTAKYTTGTEKKTYAVTPTESETTETTPGTKSNYNMSYKNALSAKMSEGVQRRDAKQDMNQYNRDFKRFDKGSFFGLGKKGSDKINPATGKAFASATEYADYKAGRSGDRDSSGNMEAGVEYNSRLNSRRGIDTPDVVETKTSTDKYDKAVHGDKEKITYVDSETQTAKVTDTEDKKDEKAAPGKFRLKKKSGAMNNFKYKK